MRVRCNASRVAQVGRVRKHLQEFKNLRPRSRPPFISNVTTPPPNRICFLANAYCGCDSRKGYFTRSTSGCCSRNLASSCACAQCLIHAHSKCFQAFRKYPRIEWRKSRSGMARKETDFFDQFFFAEYSSSNNPALAIYKFGCRVCY
jgi:hypothetical protein